MFKLSFKHRCLEEKNKHSLCLNDFARGAPLLFTFEIHLRIALSRQIQKDPFVV